MVADLDPSQGEVFLDGVERRTLPAPAWRRKVVYSAAEPGWWHERVGRPFPRRCAWTSPAPWRRASRWHPRCWMRPVVQLSTGERQRMALIRALALASPVLLLDEADRRAGRGQHRPGRSRAARAAGRRRHDRDGHAQRGAGSAAGAAAICAWRTAAWCRHEPDPAHPVRRGDRRRADRARRRAVAGAAARPARPARLGRGRAWWCSLC